MSYKLASVVLPVYNQADHIEAVLLEYLKAVDRLDFPDRGAAGNRNGPRRDNSLEICQSVEQRDKRVRTLCIDQGGWGRAVRYGLDHAGGDLICYTNSARTTARDLVLMLLYGSVHDDCVVKANRKIRENWKRRLGSLLYNLECRYLFDLAYWDINGTPKVFPAQLLTVNGFAGAGGPDRSRVQRHLPAVGLPGAGSAGLQQDAALGTQHYQLAVGLSHVQRGLPAEAEDGGGAAISQASA